MASQTRCDGVATCRRRWPSGGHGRLTRSPSPRRSASRENRIWTTAQSSPYGLLGVVGVIISKADVGQLTLIAEGGYGKVHRADEFRLPDDATRLAYKEFTKNYDDQAASAAA